MPASLIQQLQTMPTALSSAELRALEQGLKTRSLFSARATSAAYLQRLRKELAGIAAGEVSPQAAKTRLRGELERLGYTPEGGFPGDSGLGVPPAEAGEMRDLSSALRLGLQIDVNLRQAAALRQKAESASGYALYAYPGWRFTRVAERGIPRDWGKRWQDAGAECGWEGASQAEMVALKDSPIWQALGDGAGGYTDTLGADFPPFAFSSGMEWREADRATCLRLALIPEDYDPERAEPDYDPSKDEMARAFGRLDPDLRAQLMEELGA